ISHTPTHTLFPYTTLSDLLALQMNTEHHLSRRERQIMDILYAGRQATAAEVLAALPNPPSYSAVRALLRILEDKGHVKHHRDGRSEEHTSELQSLRHLVCR